MFQLLWYDKGVVIGDQICLLFGSFRFKKKLSSHFSTEASYPLRLVVATTIEMFFNETKIILSYKLYFVAQSQVTVKKFVPVIPYDASGYDRRWSI